MKGIREVLICGAGFLGGALFVLNQFFDDGTTLPEFKKASAKLESVSNEGKGRLVLKLDGIDTPFLYRSFGKKCGYVSEKLMPLQGARITLLFNLPAKKLMFSSEAYSVVGIYSDGKEICSYEDIISMQERDSRLGYPIGFGMMLFSLLGIFSVATSGKYMTSNDYPRIKDPKKFSEELQKEEQERIELEEGGRIIGNQWEIKK